MITVPQVTKEIIAKTPFLEEGIEKGIINLSSLARLIKPDIEKKLMKNVSESSILMALKRQAPEIKSKKYTESHKKFFGDITVRSNLIERTYKKTDTELENVKKLINELPKEIFISWTQGVYEMTIIASKTVEKHIDHVFSKENLKFSMNNLAAVSIKMPNENIKLPGVYYLAMKSLAWENINIIEAISTSTELTIVVTNEDVESAFVILKNLSE